MFQRSIPSENVVPDCLCHLPIHGGKEPAAIKFNPLDSSDKRCVNRHYWRGGPFDILKLKEITSNFSLFLISFAIFRQILMDAEMKDGTRAGVGLKTKQKEKEPVSL